MSKPRHKNGDRLEIYSGIFGHVVASIRGEADGKRGWEYWLVPEGTEWASMFIFERDR